MKVATRARPSHRLRPMSEPTDGSSDGLDDEIRLREMRRRRQMSSGAGGREPIDFARVGAAPAEGRGGRNQGSGRLMPGVRGGAPHDGFDESIGGKAFVARIAEGGLPSDGPSRF